MARRKKTVSEDELYVMLTQVVAEKGSQSKAAQYLEVTTPFLYDVLRRHRPIGLKIPLKLGYRRVTSYEALEEI